MREIKFRVWDSNISMMSDVGEIHFCKGGLLVYGNGVTLGNNCPNDEKIILLQYTGLKDKYQVDAYDGDICDLGGMIMVISWSDGAFNLVPPDNQAGRSIINQDRLKRFTIIGNVHENPELLQGAGDEQRRQF